MDKEDIINKIFKIQEDLIKDKFAKESACNEGIALINVLDEDIKKNSIRLIILDALIELGREEDYTKCIEALKEDVDYHNQLAGIQAQIRLQEIAGNISEELKCIDNYLEVAKNNSANDALASGYLNKGQTLYKNKEFMPSLECYERGISIAEQTHNLSLVSAYKYYIGLVLFDLGHWELGMAKLREASELAIGQHCIGIAKQSEIMRAYNMLESGDEESSKLILKTWVDNFKEIL